MRLTNNSVTELVYSGAQSPSGGWGAHYVWDELPGFGIRIYPSGKKTFVLKYRNQFNKQRFQKIGPFPEVSASNARKEAERLRGMIRAGEDPKLSAAKLRATGSVRDICTAYLNDHSKQTKKTWKTDERRIERHIYSRWDGLSALEVTKPHVVKLHAAIGRTAKVEANRALQLVHAIFAWSIEMGLLPQDTRNPALGVKRFPERSRSRWVRPHEMPWLLMALEKHGALYSRAVFQFILHTGARKGEAMKLLRADVKFGVGDATFRDTKNGTDHTVPLSPEIIAILKELPRKRGNPFVFVGNVKGQRLTTVKKSWVSIKEKARELAAKESVDIDISDVTIHDLRRTLGGWLASDGCSELLIGRVLNHTPKSVTGIYARLSDTAVRDALIRLGARLAESRKSIQSQ